MAGDWIKLHRSILDSPIMANSGLCYLWIFCLIEANWKPSKWLIPGTHTPIQIERGQFVTGRESLLNRLYGDAYKGGEKPSGSTLWRRLECLANLGCVKLKNLNNRCTLVTICNYDAYQDVPDSTCTTAEQPLNNRRTAGEQPVNTPKEGKKGRSKEVIPQTPLEIPKELDCEIFTEAWSDWQTHLLEKKKPPTATATKRQLAKLAKWGLQRAIDAIDLSIRSNWTGIFESKDATASAAPKKSRVPTDEDLANWNPTGDRE